MFASASLKEKKWVVRSPFDYCCIEGTAKILLDIGTRKSGLLGFEIVLADDASLVTSEKMVLLLLVKIGELTNWDDSIVLIMGDISEAIGLITVLV
ncbi:hypothetical protein [Halotia branconii]|uniref:Uncharacterized protein n=1 Tax=Halotia branconii CENA392 TaxID=1539056 RepID=A0AAJ6NU16_9CYAN|nr:hypothetical protein [Halotia branconii]WGV26597.1 hypothetical protein QI031_03540 [Halotia branconii CENA392]